MRTTIICLLLSVFTAISAQGQGFTNEKVNYFANKIASNTRGVMEDIRHLEDGTEFLLVKIPDAYTFDVIRALTTVIAHEYDNVRITQAWKLSDGSYYSFWMVANYHVLIMYYGQINAIVISNTPEQ